MDCVIWFMTQKPDITAWPSENPKKAEYLLEATGRVLVVWGFKGEESEVAYSKLEAVQKPLNNWQPHVDYSVRSSNALCVFTALYCWTFVKGGAHTHLINSFRRV